LLRAGQSEAAIEGVLDNLRQRGLVNDVAFAEYWVEQRQTFGPRGKRLLRAELRQHGVDSASAEAATDSVAASAEQDAYRAALKRAQHLSASALDERMFKGRLSQFLARRGFDWQTISSAVDRLWREHNV
jgi:regulatory protein